jgi:hypothetical protein
VAGSSPTWPSVYRREDGVWLIELRLRELRQLFERLDRAPFREKDLDSAAERYIDDAVRELGTARPTRLVIHLPEPECGSADAGSLPAAVANYFRYRAGQTRTELVGLLRRALVNLMIGLLFLAACLALRRSLQIAGSHEVVTEGLLIIGWVALWRPVEMFLYDWWPLRQQQNRFDAIARMPVELRPAS